MGTWIWCIIATVFGDYKCVLLWIWCIAISKEDFKTSVFCDYRKCDSSIFLLPRGHQLLSIIVYASSQNAWGAAPR
jgi:hypothetical protein